MRMMPVDEIKSIDSDNTEEDFCPFALNNPKTEIDIVRCQTTKCMAWYWLRNDTGCCALIYRPEVIDI